MTNDFLSDLDVFYGDLTTARAYVYARLPRLADDAGMRLTGQVRGPRCKLAQTLPITAPLVDLGSGPTLLARGLVPDPCFWSPDLPAIYDVTVNLLRGTEILATAHREIGLRSLGVRGRDLILNGKRWVLRGVNEFASTSNSLQEWHEVQAAYATDSSQLDNVRSASECGALSIVCAAESDRLSFSRLRQLAQIPAAAIAIIGEPLPLDFRKSEVAPNLILAQRIDAARRWSRQPWAELLVVDADDPKLVAEAMTFGEIPLVAVRLLRPAAEIPIARAACDTLQRDLAPLGQFAGYVV